MSNSSFTPNLEGLASFLQPGSQPEELRLDYITGELLNESATRLWSDLAWGSSEFSPLQLELGARLLMVSRITAIELSLLTEHGLRLQMTKQKDEYTAK